MSRVELAKALAKHAHDGQKYGEHDYFEYHVMGVANQFEDSSDEYVAALLHDVVEDSNISYQTITELFGIRIGGAIIGLTRFDDQGYMEYIVELTCRPIAPEVKIADLKFHLSQPELKNEKRYRKALTYIQGELNQPKTLKG